MHRRRRLLAAALAWYGVARNPEEKNPPASRGVETGGPTFA